MKKRLGILAAVAAAAAGSFLAVGLALAQTTLTPIGPSGAILFDHPGTNTLNAPEDLKDADLAFTGVQVADLNVGGAIQHQFTVPCVAGVNTVPISSLSGLPGGGWRVWARARDVVGNVSTWSGPLDIRFDAAPPKPPVNLRVGAAAPSP